MSTNGVMIAWCHPGTVTGGFCDSIAGLLMHTRPHSVAGLQTGPRLAEARNQVVDAFAKADAEWLWFVDTDMVFTPDTLERLLATAEVTGARIVGGLCHTSKGRPVMFRLLNDDLESERIDSWPEGEVVEVDATGTGCLLIHRSVFAEMKERFGTLPSGAENPYPWFVEGMVSAKGQTFGEDTAFCVRARSLGHHIVVDTAIRIGHIKTHVIGG